MMRFCEIDREKEAGRKEQVVGTVKKNNGEPIFRLTCLIKKIEQQKKKKTNPDK